MTLTLLSVDESSGVARFSAPDGEYRLAVCDLLGNRTSGWFWVRPRRSEGGETQTERFG